jgi:hypothetical protein
MEVVKVYGYKGCKFCDVLLRELEERKVPYEYIDIFKHGQPLWAGVFPAIEVCSYREQGYDETLADRLVKLSQMTCEQVNRLTRRQPFP